MDAFSPIHRGTGFRQRAAGAPANAGLGLLGWVCLLLLCIAAPRLAAAAGEPVYVGLDGEFSWPGSTSAQAIERGILVAIDEINARGGVLGGRPLQLVTKNNGTVPARSIQNLKDFAAMKDMVAVFCGRFSPTVIEGLKTIHDLKLIMLDPWAAADIITDHAYSPSYSFRLSLRDGWAVPTLLRHARTRGIKTVGMMALNTTWGRSNLKAAENFLATPQGMRLVGVQWFNWQDKSLIAKYHSLRSAGAQAIILVANDREASILLREMMSLPPGQRLPILSHWGVSGGQMAELAGSALQQVDFVMVQTYSFIGAKDPNAVRVLAAVKRLYGIDDPRAIDSPVGLAHGYDLTHILARAIDKAGTTDREAVRRALEDIRDYDGLVKRYARAFTPERHDALDESDVIITRYEPDGAIVPLAPAANR